MYAFFRYFESAILSKMTTETKGFAKYSWFVLVFNLLVILWGVFLRASKSGDGCGRFWLTCRGEVLPSAPELKTAIEFSHRIMSAVDGILVIILVVWAYRVFRDRRDVAARSTLKLAMFSVFFVLTEGAIGAGLVLTGNTAETLTAARPFWMAGHLINTFILLGFLTLTVRGAGGAPPLTLRRVEPKYLAGLFLGALALLIVGLTGSIAALSTMLFPIGSLAAGVEQDFSPTSHILLRLRLLHPITAILTSVFVIFLTGWLAKEAEEANQVGRWSSILALLILGQIAFGSATLFTLAPIIMQLGHLLIADAIWIAYVLFAAAFVTTANSEAAKETDVAASSTGAETPISA